MDFWFSFKKLLSIYINPVTVTLELIFLGVLLISFASRRPRKPPGPRRARLVGLMGDFGVFLVVLGMLTLFLCSIDPVANALALHLERQHPPLEEVDGAPVVETEPEFIVVLAGGHLSVPGKPTLSRLSRQALARTVGAVDLWRHFPESTFLVTGYPEETAAMRAVAERLGVPPRRILEERESRDTKDHAHFLKPILGEAPFLLVTSAIHMPRSASLFQRQGLDPVLAPVDLMVWPAPGEYDPYRAGLLVPRVFNLQLTSAALHEIGGIQWSKWWDESGEREAEPEREPDPTGLSEAPDPVEPPVESDDSRERSAEESG